MHASRLAAGATGLPRHGALREKTWSAALAAGNDAASLDGPIMTFEQPEIPEYQRERAAHINVPYPPRRAERDAGEVREPAAVSLAVSYLTQTVRVQGPAGLVDVVPVESGAVGVLPFPAPAHVISAWSPGGRPETVAANLAATGKLRAHLDAMAIDHRPAVSFPPDRSWAEGSVVLEGLSDAGATGLARLLNQPAAVRLDAAGVHLLPTGLVDVEPASLPGWVVRPAGATCPMRRDGGPGQLCRNPGGPWVSRSMEVGLVWEAHRELLFTLLGCRVCDDGSTPALGVGRAIGLTDLLVADRWGGWQFRPWS